MAQEVRFKVCLQSDFCSMVCQGELKKNQWGGEQKPGLGEIAGEINAVSLQWGAVTFPALILNRCTRLHSLLGS